MPDTTIIRRSVDFSHGEYRSARIAAAISEMSVAEFVRQAVATAVDALIATNPNLASAVK